MANKDTRERLQLLQQEAALQNNLTATLQKNLDLRTKEGKISKDIANTVDKSKGLESKLQGILNEKQKLLRNVV